MQPPSRVRTGEPIKASQFNSLRDWLVSLFVQVRHPLYWNWQGANAVLCLDEQEQFYARITTNLGGGVYAWQEVLRTATGWVDYGRDSGVTNLDVAFEANDVATISAGNRVYLRREEASGRLIFQDDTCE
jgi:hypothetical protein